MQKDRISPLNGVKYTAHLGLALLVCVGVVGLIRLGSQPASAFAAATNIQTVSLTNGVAILNEDKGSVAFCSATANSGTPPTPTGKCTLMGTVGKSAAGFIVTPNGIHMFVNNKTTGGIFQCTTLIINGQPTGGCKEIGNISLF